MSPVTKALVENDRRQDLAGVSGILEPVKSRFAVILEIVSEKRIERERLEKIHGKVWNTEEVQEEFIITGFMAPYVSCTRREDGVKGSLEFQHMPRFYFDFKEV